MIKAIEVYLITGFLGSGKTSCLNHIIKNAPPNVKTMVLMNEFGSVGIDGVLVETEDLEVLEINKGSIFCACAKTDFINALAEIAVNIRPDVLFIEATGAANPADIRRDMQLPFFKGAFSFKKQLCLIDTANFTQAADNFAAAGYQLKDADICVLNKIDISGPEQVLAVKARIAKLNPRAIFMQTAFGQINLKDVLPAETGLLEGEYPMQAPPAQHELEAMMRGMLNDLNMSLTPPDNIVSAVYLWQGDNVSDFAGMLLNWPQQIVRAKALLKFADNATTRFDWIMGQYTFGPCPPTGKRLKNIPWNHIVVLARPDIMQKFETTALNEPKLMKMAE